MNFRRKKRKGTVFAWTVILALGWVTTFLWMIFTTITVENLYPWASSKINNTDAQQVLDNQITYHNAWPLLFMGGLTVYGFASSLKREPSEQFV